MWYDLRLSLANHSPVAPSNVSEFSQCIKLVANAKRENTVVVLKAYLVQGLILSGLIAVFFWATTLPGVVQMAGMGLSGGFDFAGLVPPPTRCIVPQK
jgi:hypothetical protein